MDVCLNNNNLFEKIEEVIERYGRDRSNLIAVLLETQSMVPSHYVPRDAAEYIGKRLNVPVSKVYDVISFYSSLSDTPKARFVIQLCKSTCCKVNRYERLLGIIENELGIKAGETTEDGMFTIEYSSCFGACDVSPAIRIGHKVYGQLNEDSVREIIEMYRSGQYE